LTHRLTTANGRAAPVSCNRVDSTPRPFAKPWRTSLAEASPSAAHFEQGSLGRCLTICRQIPQSTGASPATKASAYKAPVVPSLLGRAGEGHPECKPRRRRSSGASSATETAACVAFVVPSSLGRAGESHPERNPRKEQAAGQASLYRSCGARGLCSAELARQGLLSAPIVPSRPDQEAHGPIPFSFRVQSRPQNG
jgi:hypothetical protein